MEIDSIDSTKWKQHPLQPWFPQVSAVIAPFAGRIQDDSDLVIVWDACISKECTTDAFIVTSDAHVQTWREKQAEVRATHPLNGKVVEYKNLGTGERWRALPNTLNAADSLQGLLLAINISEDWVLPDSELGGIVNHLRSIELLKFDWKPKEFRKLYRITGTIAWLISRSSKPRQAVRFLSDRDNIWNKEVQRGDVERMLTVLTEQACPHTLGQTSWSHYYSKGQYSMPAVDLVAIADRAAGVVAFAASVTRKHGPAEIQFPQAKQSRECSKEEKLARWFWGSDNPNLKRVALIVEGDTLDSAKAKLLACSFT